MDNAEMRHALAVTITAAIQASRGDPAVIEAVLKALTITPSQDTVDTLSTNHAEKTFCMHRVGLLLAGDSTDEAVPVSTAQAVVVGFIPRWVYHQLRGDYECLETASLYSMIFSKSHGSDIAEGGQLSVVPILVIEDSEQ